MAKKAIFPTFWQKWLFLANFQQNSPVATGAKSWKMAKFGQNPEKGLKVLDSGTRPIPRGLM